MRKPIAALALAGAGALLAIGVAFADGGPHVTNTAGVATTDGCAACHRTHTAVAGRLLKSSQTALCSTCHAAGATGASTDVQNGVLMGVTTGNTALRSGGFTNARIDSGNATTPGVALAAGTAGRPITSAHNIGVAGTMWGSSALGTAGAGASVTLQCGDCHNPHGNNTFRILRPLPNNATGATTTVVDVAGLSYTTANYWSTWQTGGASATSVAMWCATCHQRYATSSSSVTSDAIFTYRHRSDGANSYTARPGSQYAGQSYTTSCLQCHVAHGSNAAVGADSQAQPWPGGSAGRGNDSSLLKIDNKGTCVACHGNPPVP